MVNSAVKFLDISIDDIDDNTLVSEVLAGMMEKDIASGIDLGMTPLKKKVVDPTPKMDYRHKQVSKTNSFTSVNFYNVPGYLTILLLIIYLWPSSDNESFEVIFIKYK